MVCPALPEAAKVVKIVEKPNPIVFVVDDDPAVRSALKFSFEQEGYRVQVWPDGPAVLRAEDIGTAACLIIDLKLPGMDGLDLLDALRARKIKVPAVLITTHPPQRVRERAARGGVAIVEKPLLGNALSEGVRHAIDANGHA